MINHQTQSHLYGFDGNETHSSGTISLPVRADPYNIIMEFYVMDAEPPHNAILRKHWLHMMKVVPSTYHEMVRYPTPTRTAGIKADQVVARTILAVAQKRSGWKPKNLRTVPEEISPEKKKLKLIATE